MAKKRCKNNKVHQNIQSECNQPNQRRHRNPHGQVIFPKRKLDIKIHEGLRRGSFETIDNSENQNFQNIFVDDPKLPGWLNSTGRLVQDSLNCMSSNGTSGPFRPSFPTLLTTGLIGLLCLNRFMPMHIDGIDGECGKRFRWWWNDGQHHRHHHEHSGSSDSSSHSTDRSDRSDHSHGKHEHHKPGHKDHSFSSVTDSSSKSSSESHHHKPASHGHHHGGVSSVPEFLKFSN